MRRIFFWTHFSIGLIAALFIFVMSVTGALLSYEAEIVSWARNASITAPDGAAPMDIDQLVATAQAQGATAGNALTVSADPTDAVQLSKGRRDTSYLNPYDGSVAEDPAISAVFRRIEGIHRWLAFGGGRTETGAFLMETSNAIFAFILISGVVLWWPRKWRWGLVKRQMAFQRGLPTQQARHFNWHHVLGFWSVVPLLALVLTAVMMSYSSLSSTVYGWIGTSQDQPEATVETTGPNGDPKSIGALAALATEGRKGWNHLTITLPARDASTVGFAVDSGNGVARYARERVEVARDGSALTTIPNEATDPRFVVRFLHTGQIFGWIGQAIAGLASLAAAVLVYTGTLLGIGRLRRMAARRRRTLAHG